jgi:hypothetical protein
LLDGCPTKFELSSTQLTCKENLMSICKQAGVMLTTLLFAGAALAQTPDVKPERIRGDIVSLQGDILTVHCRSGDTVSIEVKPDVEVSALKTISLSDVKPGSYVGAEAIAGSDGKMTAASLLVFPDAARGTNEGHFAYDFGPHSTMTNANVDTVVTANNGRELKLSQGRHQSGDGTRKRTGRNLCSGNASRPDGGQEGICAHDSDQERCL